MVYCVECFGQIHQYSEENNWQYNLDEENIYKIDIFQQYTMLEVLHNGTRVTSPHTVQYALSATKFYHGPNSYEFDNSKLIFFLQVSFVWWVQTWSAARTTKRFSKVEINIQIQKQIGKGNSCHVSFSEKMYKLFITLSSFHRNL